MFHFSIFADAYEGSNEEKNGEVAEGRGSTVKYGETPFRIHKKRFRYLWNIKKSEPIARKTTFFKKNLEPEAHNFAYENKAFTHFETKPSSFTLEKP